MSTRRLNSGLMNIMRTILSTVLLLEMLDEARSAPCLATESLLYEQGLTPLVIFSHKPY